MQFMEVVRKPKSKKLKIHFFISHLGQHVGAVASTITSQQEDSGQLGPPANWGASVWSFLQVLRLPPTIQRHAS